MSKIVLIGYYPPVPAGRDEWSRQLRARARRCRRSGRQRRRERRRRRSRAGRSARPSVGPPAARSAAAAPVCPAISGAGAPGRPAIGMPGVGGRPLGLGGDDSDVGQRRIRPVGPERTLALIDTRTRHRVARPRQHLRRRRIRARRSRRHGRPRVIRGALEHRRCRRRRTVGEPGAVGVRQPERRQSRTAPEVLRDRCRAS